MTRREFMPVAVQITGTARDWSYDYQPTGIRYPQRLAAIYAGIRHFGHDDFLIAIMREDVLVGIAWQFEDRSRDDLADEAPEMARQLGLRLPAAFAHLRNHQEEK